MTERLPITPVMLSVVCGDMNYKSYSVDGDKCYHDGKLIGTGYQEFNTETQELSVSFYPITPTEHILITGKL